jgi:hypothetical protein
MASSYTERIKPVVSFIMTEALNFLMTENDDYLITDESVQVTYTTRTVV